MGFNTLLHLRFQFDAPFEIHPVTDFFPGGEVGVMSGLRHSVNAEIKKGSRQHARSL